MTRVPVSLALPVGLLLCAVPLAQAPPAPDWPQFGGPGRDFHAPAATLAAAWPAAGPRQVWARPLGEGYSGIAAVGDTLYTMYRRDDEEVVVALDAETGRTRWEHAYPAPILPDMNPEQGPGPHATPLVHGGLVYAAGATGALHALDAATGETRWRHGLITELGGTLVMRGYSSSPVAAGDLVYAQIGGDGHAVIAFEAATGRIVWRGGSFENVNASPVVVELEGERQIVALGAGEVVGLDAATGAVRWTHPHPHRFGENIPMPLWSDGLLFVTSYADGGSRVLALDAVAGETRVRELWHHRRFRVYYTNVVRIGSRVYGSSGDLGPTVFTAVDVGTGEVAWQTRDVARSSVIVAGGRLLLRDDLGHLLLADVRDDGLTVRSRVAMFEAGPPSPPALRGSRLYLRDRRVIVCLDVG